MHVSRLYAYNALNQLKQRGTTTLVYDNEGNLTSDGTTTYTWNARGELTGMTRTGLTASFAYDAFGRRISKTVNGVTTRFLYDAGDAVQEQNASGAPTANMLVGGTDMVLSRTEGASTRTFMHDGLGSAIGLLDQNGATTTSYAYEPFGATTQGGAASGNASKYTGREDDGTGLYYYRARYYSPTLQRFISQDPIGFAGGDLNLYAYVGNDPINQTDSSGLAADVLLDIGMIGYSGYVLATGKRKDFWWNLGALGADVGGALIPFATGLGIAVRAMRATKSGAKAADNLVYRALAETDNIADGLTARNVNAINSPISHVAGKKDSRWISTTIYEDIARTKYGGKNGVVQIDLNKVDNEIVDLTNGIPGYSPKIQLSRWAQKDGEVLIKNHIPACAITKLP